MKIYYKKVIFKTLFLGSLILHDVSAAEALVGEDVSVPVGPVQVAPASPLTSSSASSSSSESGRACDIPSVTAACIHADGMPISGNGSSAGAVHASGPIPLLYTEEEGRRATAQLATFNLGKISREDQGKIFAAMVSIPTWVVRQPYVDKIKELLPHCSDKVGVILQVLSLYDSASRPHALPIIDGLVRQGLPKNFFVPMLQAIRDFFARHRDAKIVNIVQESVPLVTSDQHIGTILESIYGLHVKYTDNATRKNEVIRSLQQLVPVIGKIGLSTIGKLFPRPAEPARHILQSIFWGLSQSLAPDKKIGVIKRTETYARVIQAIEDIPSRAMRSAAGEVLDPERVTEIAVQLILNPSALDALPGDIAALGERKTQKAREYGEMVTAQAAFRAEEEELRLSISEAQKNIDQAHGLAAKARLTGDVQLGLSSAMETSEGIITEQTPRSAAVQKALSSLSAQITQAFKLLGEYTVALEDANLRLSRSLAAKSLIRMIAESEGLIPSELAAGISTEPAAYVSAEPAAGVSASST